MPISTFEVSRLPCSIVEVGTAAAAPLAAVATKSPSPAARRPASFGTSTTVSLPSVRPFAVTVPFAVTFSADGSVPFGSVIGGTRRSPLVVTTEPFASVEKSPLRVRPTVPSAWRTWKYPGPSIASESGFPVCCSEPSVSVRPRSMVAAPAPTGTFCSAV